MIEEIKKCLTQYRSVLSEMNGLPLYTQLEYILTTLIEDEKISLGQEFLSEEEVAQVMGVSRPTVNKAMKALIDKGYLLRERGKRAITQNPNDLPLVFLGELISFGEMLERQHIKYHTELLRREVIKANTRISASLNVKQGENVIHLSRRRFVNDEPILIVDSYFNEGYKKLLEIPDERFNKDLYGIIREEFNITIAYAEREVLASRMDLEDTILLKTSLWEPCLMLRAINYSDKNEPVEFFMSRLKGNRCVLQSKLNNLQK